MIKQICDGCGKEIEKYARVKVQIADFNEKTKKVGRLKLLRNMELCDECKAKFTELMRDF